MSLHNTTRNALNSLTNVYQIRVRREFLRFRGSDITKGQPCTQLEEGRQDNGAGNNGWPNVRESLLPLKQTVYSRS